MKINAVFFILILNISCSSRNEKKALEMIEKGNEYMDNKNYSSALIQFKNALKFDLSKEIIPLNYRNIAVTFLYLNQADSAKYYSKLGMDCSDKNTYYHYLNKAEYLLLTHNIKEALITFDTAEKLFSNQNDPQLMEIHNNLSLIYAGNYGEQFLNLSKSLFHAKKAYKMKNNETNQEQLASVYFQLENFDEAYRLFNDLKNKHPEVKIYQFYTGQTLYFIGKEEEGMKLMKDAADRDIKCNELFLELTS
jgi:tetratricopeptide (TPR) repeat protein